MAAELTAQAPQRVRAVLAVAAVIPLPGRSFTASLPFPQRLVLPVVLRLIGTRPPKASVRRSLATGLEGSAIDRLVQDFIAEPRQYFTTAARGGAAPIRGYVTTADDNELPLLLQEKYADRLTPTVRYALPGGHLPMLTEPATLAEVIASFQALAES